MVNTSASSGSGNVMNVGLDLAEQVREAAEKIRTEQLAHDIEQAMLYAGELGAKVYRDQLRTDEAVERVARALVGVAFCAEEPDELEKLKDSRWDAFEEDARAAITALLEEDT